MSTVADVALSWLPWDAPSAAEERAVLQRYVRYGSVVGADSAASLLWCGVHVGGVLRTGFPVVAHRSRAVPGSWLLRVERAGGDDFEPLLDHAAEIFAALRRAHQYTLRVNVAFYDERPEVRRALAAALTEAGYRPAPPRQYLETLIAPVLPTDDEQLASFSNSTRRNIREAGRSHLVVRPIAYGDFRTEIDRLLVEAFTRHGKSPEQVEPMLLLSGRAEHSVLFGAFHPIGANHQELVGFAVFEKTGAKCVYSVAGTARRPELGRTPISYPLLWEGFRWARQVGCTSVDLGGVPSEEHTDDPRATIAAFKAGFGGIRATIGGEWQCTPTPLLGMVERTVQVLRRRG